MSDATHLFELNYLRLNQFKVDKINASIDRYETLNDELVFFKQQIADIRDDAGTDGLSHLDRTAIREYSHSVGSILHHLENLPELVDMVHDRDRLEHKIEHHADAWGIDSW